MAKSTSSGINFTGVLLITFIVLKLCKIIDWSWWWVMSPLLIPLGLLIIILLIFWPFKIAKHKKEKRIIEIMQQTGRSRSSAEVEYYRQKMK